MGWCWKLVWSMVPWTTASWCIGWHLCQYHCLLHNHIAFYLNKASKILKFVNFRVELRQDYWMKVHTKTRVTNAQSFEWPFKKPFYWSWSKFGVQQLHTWKIVTKVWLSYMVFLFIIVNASQATCGSVVVHPSSFLINNARAQVGWSVPQPPTKMPFR